MISVSTPHETHTTFNLTLSLTPGLPPDDELTHSIMDAMTDPYLRGLQEYLATIGISADVGVTMQRLDYASPD